MRCAVIILNWNGAELLRRYLPVVLKHSPKELARIVVADNGSEDESVALLREQFPSVEVLEFDRNYGFAEGYNRAIAAVDESIVCLLNSDVRVSARWLESPLQTFECSPKVAALQPKIRAERNPGAFEYAGAAGGFIDRLGYPFCRGRIFDTVEDDQGQYDAAQSVFWASGACLFIRRELYLEMGGLDGRFFAHQEEIDLCWRIVARGHCIVALGDSVVYHYGGASLDVAHPRKTYLNFRNNLLMLYKNMPEQQYRRVLPLRRILDFISIVQQILSGRFSHALSILRAVRDSKRMCKDFANDRQTNLAKTVVELPDGMRPYSIVWQYFVRRKRFYSSLENQHKS
ncbi:MAG: glycosyltransferase family 2 protein [Porphyromonas sp.]|nr:glycosyltransferase family 2 protein [Porphyromonas sp.]